MNMSLRSGCFPLSLWLRAAELAASAGSPTDTLLRCAMRRLPAACTAAIQLNMVVEQGCWSHADNTHCQRIVGPWAVLYR